MVWVNWRYFTEEWLKRSSADRQQIDDGDRFISLWIAFNGWMRGRYGESLRDDQQIEKVKDNQGMKQVFNELRDRDHNISSLLDELGSTPVANMRYPDREDLMKKYDGSFETFIDVIYNVRCNLFHGRKSTQDNDRDFRLVTLSYRALYPLFTQYLDKCERF